MNYQNDDTIVALATAHGSAAIAVIRLSGPNSVQLVENFFYTKSLKKKPLAHKASHSAHFGLIVYQGTILDEVLVTIFKAPHSYTGQTSVEISCHGSQFIQQQLLQLFLSEGARMANAGEFQAFTSGELIR